jgi:hypothetical protein
MLESSQDIGQLMGCGGNIDRSIDLLSKALPDATESILKMSKPPFITLFGTEIFVMPSLGLLILLAAPTDSIMLLISWR